MLSNAYFLADFCFDTAENEPAKILQNFANFPNFANPNPLTLPAGERERRGDAGDGPPDGRLRVPGRDRNESKSGLASRIFFCQIW